uniref:Uncharacterized protein n=1 Tax=Opuntia streptacantha TaxID=393608 RepID=A0A7C8ZR27_OPUST
MELEERNKWIINKLLSIQSHDIVGMGIVLYKLKEELVSVMGSKAVQQELDIVNIRKCVPASMSNEERKVTWNVCQVIFWRSMVPVVLSILVPVFIVIHCYCSIPGHLSQMDHIFGSC